jgi:hypothetical protein
MKSDPYHQSTIHCIAHREFCILLLDSIPAKEEVTIVHHAIVDILKT